MSYLVAVICYLRYHPLVSGRFSVFQEFQIAKINILAEGKLLNHSVPREDISSCTVQTYLTVFGRTQFMATVQARIKQGNIQTGDTRCNLFMESTEREQFS